MPLCSGFMVTEESKGCLKGCECDHAEAVIEGEITQAQVNEKIAELEAMIKARATQSKMHESSDNRVCGVMGIRTDEPPGETLEVPAWCFEVIYPDEHLCTAQGDQPEHIEMEVVLDSGAGAHVANAKLLPGYTPSPSALSRAGAAFLAADGGRIENQGEIEVHMVANDGSGRRHDLKAKYQVADVTRALLSVGIVYDAGMACQFHKDWAKVKDAGGQEMMHFNRKHGLYIAVVKVPNPMYKGFQRQGDKH